MNGVADTDTGILLSTLPPGPRQRRLALAVALVSLAAFAALAPFAKLQLPQIWPFIPIYQSAIVINDLITAALLFGQFGILRWRALLALAGGYLFTALMAIVHMLSFPGLFSPSGLLAGPQTTAWLYMFWHTGFPLAVAGYTLLGDPPVDDAARRERRPGVAIAACAAAAMIATAAATLFATAGHDALPAIMSGDGYTPLLPVVVGAVWAVNLLALLMLWRRKAKSVLDLWMMVVLFAWLLDIALSSILNARRFDLGFYAGRMYGLLASSFVLLVLLFQSGALYAQLARALAGERSERRRAEEQTEALNTLTASLENEVEERTAELETMNVELQAEIAERERAEGSADEARHRLAGIIDSAMDAIITVDDQQRIVVFNTTAEALFGCEREGALGASLSRFIPERFRAAHAQHIRHFGEGVIASRRMASQRIVMGLRSDGTEFPIDASISQLSLGGRKYYTVIVRDVTERLRSEEALRRSKEDLYEMATVSATAREQEKSRIARELHDELAQSLTALRMDVAWLGQRGVAPDSPSAAKLAAMETMLDRMVAATRRIAADLRPLMLDDLGLVPAAQWLVENFKDRHGIACEIDVAPPDLELQDPQATAVFRIMQESLVNVARHAQASRVDVTLERANGEIRLRVADDGRGFDTNQARKANSFGLVGLRERANLVEGRISIDSAPGRGTIVEVRIPLPRVERSPDQYGALRQAASGS
ncbi:MAG TPA: MASE4 domain-containing protein [Casimicrobiaceae bacterium]|nr:MASE4 domain-containing protein [Casimicrobiaceae bacterium]